MTTPLYKISRSSYRADVYWPHPFKTYPGPWKPPEPEQPPGPVLIDSWPVENQNDIGSYGIRDALTGPYQAFTAPRSASLKSVKLSLKRVGNPVGEVLIGLRDASGAHPSAIPGGRIGGSKKLDVTTISTATDGSLYQFDFLVPLGLLSGQQYAIVLEKFNDGSGTTFTSPDYILVGFDFTFDASPQHSGNGGYNQGGFAPDPMADMIFYLYEP